jgi:hypothetical protein
MLVGFHLAETPNSEDFALQAISFPQDISLQRIKISSAHQPVTNSIRPRMRGHIPDEAPAGYSDSDESGFIFFVNFC